MPLGSDYDGQNCSLARSLEVVGERWTLLILRDLFFGVRRFGALQAHLDIPRAVLSARLTTLVGHGLVERRPYHRGRDELHLTGRGLELWPAVYSLLRWGDRHYARGGRPAADLRPRRLWRRPRRRGPLRRLRAGAGRGRGGHAARPGQAARAAHRPGEPRAARTPPAAHAARLVHADDEIGPRAGRRDQPRVDLVAALHPGGGEVGGLAELDVAPDEPVEPRRLVGLDVPARVEQRADAAPGARRRAAGSCPRRSRAGPTRRPGRRRRSAPRSRAGRRARRRRARPPRAAAAARRRSRRRRTCPARPCGRRGRAARARHPRGGSRPSARPRRARRAPPRAGRRASTCRPRARPRSRGCAGRRPRRAAAHAPRRPGARSPRSPHQYAAREYPGAAAVVGGMFNAPSALLVARALSHQPAPAPRRPRRRPRLLSLLARRRHPRGGRAVPARSAIRLR